MLTPTINATQLTIQDPEIQKITGASTPVDVMGKLREMKNNFK